MSAYNSSASQESSDAMANPHCGSFCHRQLRKDFNSLQVWSDKIIVVIIRFSYIVLLLWILDIPILKNIWLGVESVNPNAALLNIFNIVIFGSLTWWSAYIMNHIESRRNRAEKEELEIRVAERTSELTLFNQQLEKELRERKQVESTLREAERRWRTLLDNVRLLVIGIDCNGKVEYVNPYFLELSGYNKTEVLGKDWFDNFIPQTGKEDVAECFHNILKQDFHPYYTNSIRTKSGEERLITWNNTLLQNDRGDAIGTISIGEDITQSYAIQRMKDEFVSVVSHELRTPLTSIHGALNLLISGLIEPQSERGKRIIDIAAESAERLVRLVNDILELERLESGKISLNKQLLNGAELIRQAVEMMEVMANRAGVILSVYPQNIQFYADSDRIIQVLTNLVGNAIKFSPEGSTISLYVIEIEDWVERGYYPVQSCHNPCDNLTDIPLANCPDNFIRLGDTCQPEQIIFQIKDKGRGIPADKIESIFDRFHQVDASDSRNKGGTGLGLAICRNIVEQHGGHIWVESTLGEGSSFYFSLPTQLVAEKSYEK